MLLSIGELAKELNTTIDVIRTKAEKNQIPYVLTAGGARRFDLEKVKSSFVDEKGFPLVSIGVLSKKVGVTPQTIRAWEKQGKISSIRSEAGHRRFNLVKVLKDLGLEE